MCICCCCFCGAIVLHTTRIYIYAIYIYKMLYTYLLIDFPITANNAVLDGRSVRLTDWGGRRRETFSRATFATMPLGGLCPTACYEFPWTFRLAFIGMACLDGGPVYLAVRSFFSFSLLAEPCGMKWIHFLLIRYLHDWNWFIGFFHCCLIEGCSSICDG